MNVLLAKLQLHDATGRGTRGKIGMNDVAWLCNSREV